MGKKEEKAGLTKLELKIMQVIWRLGGGTVSAVQAEMDPPLAYTTVQTMLNVLDRKGKVKRRLKDRAFVYRPVLSRQKAVTQAVGDMLDRFFGGSADSLVLNLVETRHLTPEKLSQIQALLEPRKEESRGND